MLLKKIFQPHCGFFRMQFFAYATLSEALASKQQQLDNIYGKSTKINWCFKTWV